MQIELPGFISSRPINAALRALSQASAGNARPVRAPVRLAVPREPTCLEPTRRGAASAYLILRAFNSAYARDGSFRIAVREVMKFSAGEQLDAVITTMAQETGSFLNAWACCLMWLHDRGDLTAGLSAAALQDVVSRVEVIDADVVERAQDVLEEKGRAYVVPEPRAGLGRVAGASRSRAWR